MALYGRPLTEELIATLTRFPEVELWGMLRRYHIPQSRKPCREPGHSSLGPLGNLPMELLTTVVEFLDFQSLLRLMRVSLRWKTIVETLPAYLALSTHVQAQLNTLGITGMLKHHAVSALHGALRLQACASCFEFGGFLFLPTCERICFACLLHNQAYWMLSAESAQFCFTLTEAQVRALPILHAVPGVYFVGASRTQRAPVELVSVKQAKQLADRVHGSARMTAVKFVDREPFIRLPLFQRLHNISLEPPGRDLSRARLKERPDEDYFCGTAAIRFPYVRGGVADIGRLCRGCEYISRNFEVLPDHVKAQIVPEGVDKKMPLRAIATRLRSKRGFVEHIVGCYGVERLLAESKD
ncbi:hypothetical protein F4825DRAFT_433927 [Nemania diffusa]|nr:hypothetical protein F4825DRAFT_433927 [Nemania diffusa]